MTNQELIEMAEKVYGKCDWHKDALAHLKQLAKLVIEHERGKYTKLYEEEIRSIRKAATQYGIPSEDAAGMLLFCEEFARMVAEKEREACANTAGLALLGADKALNDRVLKAIRARGQE